MAAPVDSELAALVGRVLPRLPNAMPWAVAVVDRLEDCGAEINGTVATVRVHRTWLNAVYEAGFSCITRHFPLALDKLDLLAPETPQEVLVRSIGGVNLWRAITIERDYCRGRFTGGLSLGEAYVAQTCDRLGCCANEVPLTAVRRALSEQRSRIRAASARTRMMIHHRNRLSELIKLRWWERKYDASHQTSLEPFRALLPPRISRTLDHYGGVSVPLAELERNCVDAVFEISEDLLPSLIYQLELAVQHAERASPRTAGRLAPEDEIALETLAI